SRIVRREESHARDIKKTGVHLVAVEDRYETAELAIEASVENHLPNLFFRTLPGSEAIAGNEIVFHQSLGAVEGGPGHHLGVHMLPALGALFPDPAVRLFPPLGHTICQTAEQPLHAAIQLCPRLDAVLDGTQQLSVEVQLRLI